MNHGPSPFLLRRSVTPGQPSSKGKPSLSVRSMLVKPLSDPGVQEQLECLHKHMTMVMAHSLEILDECCTAIRRQPGICVCVPCRLTPTVVTCETVVICRCWAL